MAGLADLLTVEEAARVIRVGRTKAYAMAREWRATGGRSGLPVIDFGNVLRVPLCQLEAMVGGPLTKGRVGATTTAAEPDAEAPPTADAGRPEQAPTPEPAPAPAVSDSTPSPPRLPHPDVLPDAAPARLTSPPSRS